MVKWVKMYIPLSFVLFIERVPGVDHSPHDPKLGSVRPSKIGGRYDTTDK